MKRQFVSAGLLLLVLLTLIAGPAGAQERNHPPVAVPDYANLAEPFTYVVVDVVANDYDLDGDAILVTGLLDLDGGQAWLGKKSGTIVFRWVNETTGHPPATVHYLLEDKHGASSVGTLTVYNFPTCDEACQ